MNMGLLFFQFMPLLLYIGFEYWKGFKAGIIAAILGSLALLAFDYFSTGAVDSFSMGECVLILLLGIVSLKMNNERFFKFQPTVVAAFIAIVFLYFEFQQTPLLVRYIPQIERLFAGQEHSPEIQAMIDGMHTAQYEAVMAALSRVLIFLFVAHGLLMAYAALYLSTSRWFFCRLLIYPAFLVATMIVGASTR